jgi:hypothetical protein
VRPLLGVDLWAKQVNDLGRIASVELATALRDSVSCSRTYASNAWDEEAVDVHLALMGTVEASVQALGTHGRWSPPWAPAFVDPAVVILLVSALLGGALLAACWHKTAAPLKLGCCVRSKTVVCSCCPIRCMLGLVCAWDFFAWLTSFVTLLLMLDVPTRNQLVQGRVSFLFCLLQSTGCYLFLHPSFPSSPSSFCSAVCYLLPPVY